MQRPQEKWRPVVGYEGLYEVSNLGGVRSLARMTLGRWGSKKLSPARRLKGSVSKSGKALYVRYDLSSNGKTKHHLAHRLVAQAFIPNPDSLPHINHIDNDPQNNEVSNLEWCTPKQNSEHMVKQGRHSNGVRTAPRNSECNYGHPMSGENLYQRTDKNGFLVYKCRTCARRWEKERRMRQRNQGEETDENN